MKRVGFLCKLIYLHVSIISFHSSLQLTIKPKTYSLSYNTDENNLPPIHAAPPESRTRLLPPLLKKSETVIKRKANVTYDVIDSKTNNKERLSKNGLVPKLNKRVKNKSLTKKANTRLEHKENAGLPLVSRGGNSLHKGNRPNEKTVPGLYSKADIEELLQELNSLNDFLNNKKVSRLQSFDVEQKNEEPKNQILILHQAKPQSKTVGDFQSEHQNSKKDMTFHANPNNQVVEAPINNEPVHNNATSVLHQLKNGPIETILKQNGFLLNTLFETKNVLPGSNIPIYRFSHNKDAEVRVFVNKNPSFENSGDYAIEFNMPLSRMVPTNSVYRVNATVYVSNKHHPRVVFYNSSNIDRFMQRNGNHARETIPYRICYPKKNTNLVFTIKMGVESKQVVFLNNNYSEFILPNFRRSSKNECALESIESIRLYPDLEKFKREILNQPNVIENLVNFHTHNKNYNLRMIFLNSPLIFSDCFLTCSIPMKFQRTTKHDIKNKQDVLWRWRSLQPKGIVGLIQDEENSLQAFQNEHDEENKKKENAVKSHNETVPHKENVNVESIVDKVLEKTETQGGARLASYEGMQQFNDMLKGVARVWLQKWWHIGQCIRDYERLCPLNWERSVEEMCVPPSDYKGPCAATSLKRASYTVKENFSISCEVDWPCIHSTALNARYNCPKRWENPGGALCIAPNDYSGKCSPATDFTGFSIEEKSQWASICDVDWFVKGSNNDEKTRSKTAWSSSLSIGKNERNGPINPSTGVIVLDSKHESFAI